MGLDTQAVNVSHMRVLSGCMKFDRQLNDRVDRKADIRPITWKVSEDRSATWEGSTDQLDDIVFLALVWHDLRSPNVKDYFCLLSEFTKLWGE